MTLRRLAFVFFLPLVLSACTLSREAVLSRTSVGLNAARAAFTAEDERQQMELVASAGSKEAAEAMVAAHREKRDVGTKAFQAAWVALAVASLEPTDANLKRLSELAAVAVATLAEAGALP